MILGLTLSLVTLAKAQYAEDVYRFSQQGLNVGARTLGIGNAGVGYAADYSALFWNPANLAGAKETELSLGANLLGYSNNASYFGTSLQSDEYTAKINNVGFLYPFAVARGALTIAMGFGNTNSFRTTTALNGYNSQNSLAEAMTPFEYVSGMTSSARKSFLENNIPYQLYLADLATNNNGTYLDPVVTDSVHQEATIKEDGGIGSWSFGGALDIAQNLSIGVSANILSGTYSYDRQFTESDTRNIYHYGFPYNFKEWTLSSTIKSELSGFNMLFGITYRKPGLVRLGITYRTPTTYDINEEFSDDGSSYFKDGSSYSVSQNNATAYKIKTPAILSAGAALQLSDWLVVAGDAEYTDWKEMQFETSNADLLAENRYIARAFKATTNLRGGAEVTLWDLGLVLRGGMIYNPSAYASDKPENNQVFFTGGFGYHIDENNTINIGAVVGKWKTFRYNYFPVDLGGESRTSESVQLQNINVTMTYYF